MSVGFFFIVSKIFTWLWGLLDRPSYQQSLLDTLEINDKNSIFAPQYSSYINHNKYIKPTNVDKQFDNVFADESGKYANEIWIEKYSRGREKIEEFPGRFDRYIGRAMVRLQTIWNWIWSKLPGSFPLSQQLGSYPLFQLCNWPLSSICPSLNSSYSGPSHLKHGSASLSLFWTCFDRKLFFSVNFASPHPIHARSKYTYTTDQRYSQPSQR